MRFKKIFYLSLILLSAFNFFAACYAEKEFGRNGKEFSAKLCISNDPYLDSKWNYTQEGYGPFVHTVKEAYRGETITVRIFFMNMALDETGACDVTYDIEVLDPAGNKYFSEKNLPAMKKKIDNPKGVFLSDTFVGNEFEEKDIFGKYHIKAVVHDNVAKKEVKEEGDIILIEYGSDKKELSEEELGDLAVFYYQRPNSHRALDLLRMVYLYKQETKSSYDKEQFALQMAPMFRAIFKDNKYLIPHFVSYFKKLDAEKRMMILPIVKGIMQDYPDLVTRLELKETEKKVLDSIAYPDIWDNKIRSALELDMLWMSFFVTGDIKPIEQLVKAIKLREEKDINKAVLGSAAIWSITSNCRQHELVRAYCIAIYEHDNSLDGFTKSMLGKCINDSKPN